MENNNLNKLSDELIKEINSRNDLFKPIYILTPSKNVSNYFKECYLKNNNDKVLMNVKFLSFNELFSLIFKNKEIIDDLEYKLLLEDLLFNNNEKELNTYLNKSSNDYYVKLYDLTLSLNKLFKDYEESLEINNLNNKTKENNFLINIYKELNNKIKENNLNTLYNLITDKNNYNNKLDNLYVFGFININPLYEEFLSNCEFKNRYDLKLDKSYKEDKKFKLIKAPNVKREIEYLHSKICELLLSDKESKYSSFLVVAPNINDYKNVIKEVFNQDNKEYPSIPYNIKERKDITTNTYNILKLLFNSISLDTFTRLDYFNLLNNEIIKNKYNINDEIKDILINLIIKNNIYSNDDFLDFKNRILLSKFLDYKDDDNNTFILNNKEYMSYDSIEINNDIIISYISLINDIFSFKDYFKSLNNTFINKDNINEVFNKLKLFLDEDTLEFKKINKFINKIESLENISLNLSSFKFFLLDLVKEDTSNLFNSNVGVSFISFNTNYVLNYKYIFFIGLSSKNIPSLSIQSEFDSRKDYSLNELNKIKDVFKLTYLNTEYFYPSYLGMDLKKEEEFYPSILLDNLIDEEILIPLDEKRGYKDLYTLSEFKNKEYYNSLMNNSNKINNKVSNYIEKEKPSLIKIRDISKFLKDPFTFKVENVFPYDDDKYEKLKDEFKDINITSIDKPYIIKKLCLEIILNNINENNDSFKNNFKNKLLLDNKLPSLSKEVINNSFNNIWNTSFKIIELLKEFKELSKDNIIKSKEYLLNNFKVLIDKEFYKIEDKDSIKYYEFKYKDGKLKNEDYVDLYILSLLDISSKEDDIKYNIELIKSIDNKKSFRLSKNESIEILNNIYSNMFNYDNIYSLPINFIDFDKIKTFKDFISHLNTTSGPYKYFKDKKMFNFDKDLGYEEDYFDIKFKEYSDNQKKLIKFLQMETGE